MNSLTCVGVVIVDMWLVGQLVCISLLGAFWTDELVLLLICRGERQLGSQEKVSQLDIVIYHHILKI
jgi:hypothetical protein